MKITTRKKHAVLASLVLILGVAVLANWYLATPDANISQVMGESDIDSDNVDSQNLGDAIYVNSSEVSDEYFASAKLSRDNSYDEAVATLKEIVNSSEADADSVKNATDAIAVMSQRKIEQTNIENLVEAKTGSGCVAVISDSGVEVIIDELSVSDDTILQIKEIVINNTDFSQEKISIIAAK
ncbi:MAG: SpoIIIAH-like family protein [Clostridia bacterium]|nr:SpoIIIAH-like family protein [Clostridia bacterium]